MRGPLYLAFVMTLVVAGLATGCGGNLSTASKSAAAFDAAQKQGVAPTTGEAHGGHGQAGAETPTQPQRGGTDHSQMTGMDHAGMDHSGTGRTDTAQSGHAAHPAGHGATGAPSSQPRQASPSPRMDHSNMAGMDQSKMATGQGVAAVPERPSAVADPGQPAVTLRPDELDAPALTSIRDATRATAMAGEMAGGGHGMPHGVYRQIDAGRDDASATPSPSTDPHSMHAKPAAPRPTPTPRPKEDHQ